MSKISTLLSKAVALLSTLLGRDYATAEASSKAEAVQTLFRLILEDECSAQIRAIKEDIRTEDLGILYEQLLAIGSDRKMRGVFYTPQPAVEFLVDLVLENLCKQREIEWDALPRVLDPACGSGLILLRVAEWLARRLSKRTSVPIEECRKRVVEHSIFGIDIDPVACVIAEYSLKNYCGQEVSTHILHKDALLQPASALFPCGCDAVITNPPYIGEKGNKEIFEKYYTNPYISRYCEGKMDLWYLFGHLSLDSTTGIVGILATDYWESATGAKLLQKRIKARPHTLYSFNASLFKDAPGVHNQILLLNTTSQARYRLKEEFRPICSKIPKFTTDMFILELPRRVHRTSEVTLGEIVHISQGVVPGPDRISAKAMRRFEGGVLGAPVFVLPKDHSLLTRLSKLELQALKPFAYPRQLRPVTIKLQPEHRIIDIRGSETEVYRDYPNILEHLDQYRPLLQSRRETLKGVRHWYELHWPRHKDCFVGNRIVSVRQTRSPIFCLIETECYFDLSVNIIQAQELELLEALATYLNTQPVRDFLRAHGKMKGKIFQIDSEPLKAIPIPKALLCATEERERLRCIYHDFVCSLASAGRTEI